VVSKRPSAPRGSGAKTAKPGARSIKWRMLPSPAGSPGSAL
jgi:hypothetical protein